MDHIEAKHIMDGRRISASLFCKRDHLSALIRWQKSRTVDTSVQVPAVSYRPAGMHMVIHSMSIQQAEMQWIGRYIYLAKRTISET